jgi:hypothetical protein
MGLCWACISGKTPTRYEIEFVQRSSGVWETHRREKTPTKDMEAAEPLIAREETLEEALNPVKIPIEDAEEGVPIEVPVAPGPLGIPKTWFGRNVKKTN